MENLKLGIFDIFKGENELFLSSGDHYLLRVSGDDCHIMELIINGFKETSNIESVYKTVQTLIEHERFDNLITWLIKNNILYEENQQNTPEIKNHKVVVWGDFNNFGEVEEKIIKRLDTKLNKFQLKALINAEVKEDDIKGADLILMFSPIFSNYDSFLKVNEISHELKIPSIHIGVGINFFSIGPFSVPASNTPCLRCYSKRKIANIDHKEKYLKFVKYNDQKILHNNDIMLYYDLGLMVEFLKSELENYYTRHSMYLFARSITIDLMSYNIVASKVLRVPSCDICDNSTINSPIN